MPIIQLPLDFSTPKLCECGCGKPTPIATQKRSAIGHVPGQPIHFINGHNRRGPSVASFWSYIRVLPSDDPCWEWTGVRSRGYGILTVDGRGKRAHRVAYEITYGPFPEHLRVLHKCDNPPCVRPEHLFLGTDADNIHDKEAKGRGLVGERCPLAKLTVDKVRAIRADHAAGVTVAELARRFGVAWVTIQAVVRYKTWKHA